MCSSKKQKQPTKAARQKEMRALVERVYGGQPSGLLADILVGNQPVSQQELDLMTAMIEKAKKLRQDPKK